MQYYVCNHCNRVFSESEAKRVTFLTDGLSGELAVCPDCLNADYDDAAYCYHCKKPIRYENLKGGYYCTDCLRELSTVHLLRQYIKQDLDSFAVWLHERRARYEADEQDAKDRQHL